MSRLLVLLSAVAAAVSATDTLYSLGVEAAPSPWRQWISLLFSRGLYLVLGILILGCFLLSSVRSKVEERSGGSEDKTELCWSSQSTVVKSLFLPSSDTRSMSLKEMCSTNTSSEIGREAEARNKALKKELEQMNRIRLSLEERSGQLEREKAEVEERLEETKLQAALENDSLRKEAAVFQRQLHQLQEEKEVLRREVESTARDWRMTECALKDQALLGERLEEARKEVMELQRALDALRQERDTAVAIAADLAVRCQGVAGQSTHIIGKYIKREMERMKPEEDSILKLVAGTKPDNGELENDKGDEEEKCALEQSDDHVRDDNASSEADCPCPECTNHESRWNEMVEDGEETSCRLGPVTGSEAFRSFLISSFADQ